MELVRVWLFWIVKIPEEGLGYSTMFSLRPIAAVPVDRVVSIFLYTLDLKELPDTLAIPVTIASKSLSLSISPNAVEGI